MNKKIEKILLFGFVLLLLVFIARAQQQGEDCIVVGEINNSLFCSIDGFWESQKDANSPCINNFECISEICQNDVCQDESIISLLTQAISQLPPAPSGAPSGGGGGTSSGIINSYSRGSGGCVSQWNCTKWSACINGKKTRVCKDDNGCQREEPIYDKPSESMLCMLIGAESCADNIKNQNEEEVDCGGPCDPCKTCYDSEQNCHDGLCEESVDCGGPCDSCPQGLSGTFWASLVSGLLVALLVIIGLLYWKLKGEAKEVGKEEQVWEHHLKPEHHKHHHPRVRL